MAKKSKTQRAKASAVRAAKKSQAHDTAEDASAQQELAAASVETSKKTPTLFKRMKKTEETPANAPARAQRAPAKKEERKPEKKKRFRFLSDVRAEMKRVTWPSKQDVVRWSGVVVAALLFFGIYVSVLDNVIVVPALVLFSGLG